MKQEELHLANGRRWLVHTAGAGPSLLWLHGLRGVDPADPLLTRLQERFRVVAPVAPGFEDLEELARTDSIHDLALDYDDLLTALDIGPSAIVGHSFGAMIAAEIAAHFPGRAKSLTLLAPFGLWNDAYPVADIFAIPYTQMDELLWGDEETRARFVVPPTESDARAAADQMIRLAQSLTAIAKFIWPIPDRGLSRRLARVKCPALCVFGAHDRVIPHKYSDDFRKGLTGAETHTLDGAGHMLPYERPEAIAALIERLCART